MGVEEHPGRVELAAKLPEPLDLREELVEAVRRHEMELAPVGAATVLAEDRVAAA